jgi:hypothetical protein
MKRTKYGKNRQKTIYIPNEREQDYIEVVDDAEKQGEGVGILLLDAYKKDKMRSKYGIAK